MIKKIAVISAALFSLSLQADYINNDGVNIAEYTLEKEQREQVECLASLNGGSLGECKLNNAWLEADRDIGVISAGETYIDAGVPELSSLNGLGLAERNDPLSSGGLSKIIFEYGNSALLDAEFSHYQNCDYVKSAIEGSDILSNYTPDKEAWDNVNISASEYSELNCLSNSGSNITATNIVGKKHYSTGQEEGLKQVDHSCTGTSRRVGPNGVHDLYEAHCDNGLIYNVGFNNYPTIEGFNTQRIPFTLTTGEPAVFDYSYERFYKINATPGAVIDGILAYDNINIKYVVNKFRTVPIEEYDRLAPVDVAGITVFIPIPPAFTQDNLGAIDSQTLGSVSVNYHGLTTAKIGCEAESIDINMTTLSGDETLTSDQIYTLRECSDIQLSFENLQVQSDFWWELDYLWNGDELSVWHSYATFLTEEASDILISSTYIAALESAVNQTNNDSQALLLTLSNYIIGNPSFRTGLWGFLKQEGAGFGFESDDDILAEINRLTTGSQYDDGVLIIDDADLPDYWISFVFSNFAQNISILDKLHLLDVAKNIVDVSAAGGDTSTLVLQLEPVLATAQKKHLEVVDKAIQFFSFIDARSTIKTELKTDLDTTLNGLTDALDSI